MSKAHFGLIGLGVMGENLVLNAERNGFSSVVFNRTYSKTEEFLQGRGLGKNIEGAENLQEFVNKLERPRRILMMVKAGPATDAVIDNISGYLEEGDLLIDGGYSQFKDTERRVNTLESKSFGYIGMGVSGGAKGALEGPSMMPGGTKASYDAIESLLTKMAAKVEDGPCVAYVGPGGSGHFVKTDHNGIEYGIEQILAEAYDLMKRVKGMNGQQMSEVFGIWNNTDELASYLVEITEICLNTKDEKTGDYVVEKILDKAGQKGTGLWTVVSALELGVSVPTIYASLNARVMSSLKEQRSEIEKTIPTKIQKNLNGWVAGCDICQDVCPWNKSVPYNNTFENTPKEWIKNLSEESLSWNDKTWEKNLKGTTLKRIKPWMWRRNIKANLKHKKSIYDKIF